MGGLEVSNEYLRCPKCLEIKRLTIKPEYPESKVKMNCRCSEKEINLYEYLKDLKKKDDFKIICAKCQKDPKEPKYCYECQKIYCVKCSDFHSQLSNLVSAQNENKDDIFKLIGHKVIDIDKVDFHCILHPIEKFSGFCKKCLLNYCPKCEEENLHKDHEVQLFSSIIVDKKKKELIKEGKKNAQSKIDYNHSVCKKIRKKIKDAENKKQIETLSKENEKNNEKILEFFDFLYDIYDKAKHKNYNYSIIFNVVNNMNFNVDKLKFDKNKHEEEDALLLIDYLKTDFIIHTEESMKRLKEKEEKEKKEGENKNKEANNTHDGQLFEEKYKDIDDEEDKKDENKEDKKEDKEKKEDKKEDKKEESKKEKKEREKKEKEEKAKKEKEDKERAKKEEKEKKEKEKKEKEEKAKKEKEDKERAKKEEKEKKEKEKKEKEEKAKKEKEDKEKAKKEEKEKKEKAKKEKDKKNKDKSRDKDKSKDKKKDKGKNDEKDKKVEKRPSQPLPNIISTGAAGKIGDKKAFLQQMMGGMGGGPMGMKSGPIGMGMGRPAPMGSGAASAPGEKPVQIEHTRNEGDTVEILNNIQVQKTAKKKPRKINFDGEN